MLVYCVCGGGPTSIFFQGAPNPLATALLGVQYLLRISLLPWLFFKCFVHNTFFSKLVRGEKTFRKFESIEQISQNDFFFFLQRARNPQAGVTCWSKQNSKHVICTVAEKCKTNHDSENKIRNYKRKCKSKKQWFRKHNDKPEEVGIVWDSAIGLGIDYSLLTGQDICQSRCTEPEEQQSQLNHQLQWCRW